MGKAEGISQGLNASGDMTIKAHFHTTVGDGIEVFESLTAYNNRKKSASIEGNKDSIMGCYSQSTTRQCGCHYDYGGTLTTCPTCHHSEHKPTTTDDYGNRLVDTCSKQVFNGYGIGCGYEQGEIISITLKVS